MGVHRFGQTGLMVGFAISVIYWLVLAVVISAARGVFVANSIAMRRRVDCRQDSVQANCPANGSFAEDF